MPALTVLEFSESDRNPARNQKELRSLYYVLSNVWFQCSKPRFKSLWLLLWSCRTGGCSILTPSLLVAFIVRDSRKKLGMISATSWGRSCGNLHLKAWSTKQNHHCALMYLLVHSMEWRSSFQSWICLVVLYSDHCFSSLLEQWSELYEGELQALMVLYNYLWGWNWRQIVKLLESDKLNPMRMLSRETILDVRDKLMDRAATELGIMWAR